MTIVQESSASVVCCGARSADPQDTGLRQAGPGAADAVLHTGRRSPSKRCLFAARLSAFLGTRRRPARVPLLCWGAPNGIRRSDHKP